jgi:hypothetical protein
MYGELSERHPRSVDAFSRWNNEPIAKAKGTAPFLIPKLDIWKD